MAKKRAAFEDITNAVTGVSCRERLGAGVGRWGGRPAICLPALHGRPVRRCSETAAAASRGIEIGGAGRPSPSLPPCLPAHARLYTAMRVHTTLTTAPLPLLAPSRRPTMRTRRRCRRAPRAATCSHTRTSSSSSSKT